MIVYDDGFFGELDDNRILAITGRLSSGKTLMAVQLAQRYLARGYRLISQTGCVWNDEAKDIVPDSRGKLHCVIIIDEGGLYFRTQDMARAVSSFAAKLDCYVIFAGRKLPHKDLCSLTCQMWFNALRWFWLPFKVWRYSVENGQKTYSGFFLETAWWDFYGVYDTLDPGDDPIRIVRQMEEWTRTYFARYGRTYSLSDVGGVGGSAEQELANELAENVSAFANAASSVSQQSKKWRR